MLRFSSMALLLLGAAPTACGPPEPGESCDPPAAPQTFELGTGQSCFERLTAGGTITVNSGPQGGYHVWLAVGCSDCDEETDLVFGVKDPTTGDWLAGTQPTEAIVPLFGEKWKETAGKFAYLPGNFDDPPDPGTPVVLFASVKDRSGVVKHEAQVDLVLGATKPYDP